MNKIIVDKDNYLSLENENVELISQNNILNIKIIGNVLINELIINEKNTTVNIELTDNSKLIYNRYVHKTKGIYNLNIKSNNNSIIVFNNSLYLDDFYEIVVNNKIIGNNNSSYFNIKSFNKEHGKIKAQGYLDVNEHSKNNLLTENFKIITTNKEKNIVFPALIINSDDVIANHYTTISPINNDELFYLNTKGIAKNLGKIILRNSFILNNFENEEFKNIVKKKLEE